MTSDTSSDGSDSPSTTAANYRAEMAGAIRQVRREAKKAAVVPSVVDAAVVTLLTNLVLRLFALPIPSSVSLALLPGVTTDVTVHVALPIALGLGVVVAVAEYGIRMRTPPVEQFETVNPSVSEALRTARDVLRNDTDADDAGDDTSVEHADAHADAGATSDAARMTRALYEDVLERLRTTSSVELLPTRRVVGALVIALLLSAGSIQVAITDIQINTLGDDQAVSGDLPEGSDRQTDLQNGSEILGDAEDIAAGSEEVNATLSGTSGDGDGPDSSAAAYDSTGYEGDTGVESQRAGYLDDDTLEEAELIRDYTLKIREQDDE
ncbi:hypothetical protein C440_13419 [Haloferax mucosum ATCC BAA-1512]|uniref:Uncharacterized protein n=1 Tax=Haloferax mucosum ATCC BAA-1512 TaxID=662479 RepID=M0I3I0_9EURY|nr:hypothetical protein [Haloferax mucosum]ELZ91316.1 hypothetical protein C440_13419 [Haloferax mucosum ATCC BAA-1512]